MKVLYRCTVKIGHAGSGNYVERNVLVRARNITDALRKAKHFGAREVPRRQYLEMLRGALDHPTRRGRWALELDQAAFAASGGAAGAGDGGPELT